MEKEDLQKALEALSKGGISVAGDLVMNKTVEYEVNNVEAGGIGIQIVDGNRKPAITAADKDIKAAIDELLKAKDDSGELIFRNKKQWWAVYRVLESYCQYPKKMTAFVSTIKELSADYASTPTAITYDSLQAAPKEVPLMATCVPAAWKSLKDKSENYMQQYEVAEWLMLKLGIKS